jgi:hypothetical protein
LHSNSPVPSKKLESLATNLNINYKKGGVEPTPHRTYNVS